MSEWVNSLIDTNAWLPCTHLCAVTYMLTKNGAATYLAKKWLRLGNVLMAQQLKRNYLRNSIFGAFALFLLCAHPDVCKQLLIYNCSYR